MLNWYQLKGCLYLSSAKKPFDLLTLFFRRHVFTARATTLSLGRMTIGVLVLYPLMDLDDLILGTMIIVSLRYMRYRIADSGTMTPLINSQTSFVTLTVALMRVIRICQSKINLYISVSGFKIHLYMSPEWM